MSADVLRIDPTHPEQEPLARAAEVLRQGGLIAFPTETVYGLGASALDAAAVERIFVAKGRPSRNPVIVHVHDVAAAKTLVTEWSAAADRLAERFWPGPLTMVLPRAPAVPDVVTAGGATVGIRIPSHPVALALLRTARLPIAAPSANLSTQLSPTRAEHVVAGLGDRVDLILDGGPCPGGLESTVVDLTKRPPRLLRPGLISPAALREVLGAVMFETVGPSVTMPLPSPGLMERHYAPRTPLRVTKHVKNASQSAPGQVGIVALENSPPGTDRVHVVPMPLDPDAYAARLYAVLHDLDQAGLDLILVEAPPETEAWLAVHDRLRRAEH